MDTSAGVDYPRTMSTSMRIKGFRDMDFRKMHALSTSYGRFVE